MEINTILKLIILVVGLVALYFKIEANILDGYIRDLKSIISEHNIRLRYNYEFGFFYEACDEDKNQWYEEHTNRVKIKGNIEKGEHKYENRHRS